MSGPQPEADPPHDCYVVILSGTHVTGKESLAVSLAEVLHTNWIKAEMVHTAAGFGARSQARKDYSFDEVFDRIWFTKLLRLGFLADRGLSGGKPDGTRTAAPPRKPDSPAAALITCYAMRPPVRTAMRKSMWSHGIKPVFVIMQITKETLSGRTLGAETPELAERIMGEKIADLEEPLEDETDVIMIDSTKDVDELFTEIQRGIREKLGVQQLP